MIVPDINLLVYAYNRGAPRHDDARRWWEGLVNGTEVIGLPWVVSTGFIRLIANPTVAAPHLSLAAATAEVGRWLEREHVVTLNPGDHHLEYLARNLAIDGATAKLTTDAHIAALAMENGAEVHTHNAGDFRRFPGLLWRDPLSRPGS